MVCIKYYDYISSTRWRKKERMFLKWVVKRTMFLKWIVVLYYKRGGEVTELHSPDYYPFQKHAFFLLLISKTCSFFTTHFKNIRSFCATLYIL
jgi:hypothetical protein